MISWKKLNYSNIPWKITLKIWLFNSLKMMYKNKPICKGLQTQTSRTFPGSLEKNPVLQGIPGLERKIPKFKDLLVFQVRYEPWK